MAIDKGKQKQAARRVDAAIQSELDRKQGSYRAPDRAECVLAKEMYMPIDDAGTLRIVTRIWRQDGRMTEFLLAVEAGSWADAESWQELARIDCSGGTCHEHPVDRPDDHVTIHRLDVIDDVQRSYPAATSRITDIARKIRDRRTS